MTGTTASDRDAIQNDAAAQDNSAAQPHAAVQADPAAWLDALHWDERGLVPAIAQDATTGRVLMMAWMNREALSTGRARATGSGARARSRATSSMCTNCVPTATAT